MSGKRDQTERIIREVFNVLRPLLKRSSTELRDVYLVESGAGVEGYMALKWIGEDHRGKTVEEVQRVPIELWGSAP
jgi:hypothetical protein